VNADNTVTSRTIAAVTARRSRLAGLRRAALLRGDGSRGGDVRGHVPFAERATFDAAAGARGDGRTAGPFRPPNHEAAQALQCDLRWKVGRGLDLG
jgi:hypothetical protein